MAGGWGHWKLCSLTHRAWAVCQHGGLSTVRLLTWQLRAKSARDPVTRWMLHHLLRPSLEKSVWRSQSFIIKEVISPSGLMVRIELHLLVGGMSKVTVVREGMWWDTLFGHSEEFSTHLVAHHHVQFYHSCGPGTRTQLGRVQSPHLWRACAKYYKNQWYKQGIPKRATWMVLIILQLDGKIPEVRDTGLYSFRMHHGT